MREVARDATLCVVMHFLTRKQVHEKRMAHQTMTLTKHLQGGIIYQGTSDYDSAGGYSANATVKLRQMLRKIAPRNSKHLEGCLPATSPSQIEQHHDVELEELESSLSSRKSSKDRAFALRSILTFYPTV